MKNIIKKICSFALAIIYVIGMNGCASKETKIESSLTECAEKYGLKDVSVIIPELRRGYTNSITVCSSNFKQLEWDSIFKMHKEMEDSLSGDYVSFKNEDSTVSYYVSDILNEIEENNGDKIITYSGTWDDKASEDANEHHKKYLEDAESKDSDSKEVRCWYCSKVIIYDGEAIHSTNTFNKTYKCDYCGKENVID